jgi:hypothetical protein
MAKTISRLAKKSGMRTAKKVCRMSSGVFFAIKALAKLSTLEKRINHATIRVPRTRAAPNSFSTSGDWLDEGANRIISKVQSPLLEYQPTQLCSIYLESKKGESKAALAKRRILLNNLLITGRSC